MLMYVSSVFFRALRSLFVDIWFFGRRYMNYTTFMYLFFYYIYLFFKCIVYSSVVYFTRNKSTKTIFFLATVTYIISVPHKLVDLVSIIFKIHIIGYIYNICTDYRFDEGYSVLVVFSKIFTLWRICHLYNP